MLLAIVVALFALDAEAQLMRENRKLFAIGSYELPKDDAELRRMAESGFNLVRCGSRADLERVAQAGMQGWMVLPMTGPLEQVRQKIRETVDHPALAVWEGPDEMIWNFTAFSGLYPKVHKERGEWNLQTPNALAYASKEGGKVLAAFRESAKALREMDPKKRPLWMNEAAETDMKYIRETLADVQITGCDLYPIRSTGSEPASIGDITRRYMNIGEGRPVWMVLQGFSWHVFPERKRTELYPNFDETRMMAWDAIVNGAQGILYWGSFFVPAEGAEFRQSLHAMAAELAPLHTFLTAAETVRPTVELIESNGRSQPGDRGVRAWLRRAGNDWLLALVNEDSRAHTGVEITGLTALNGRRMELLYGEDSEPVRDGTIVVRMRPLEVKIYATSRRLETSKREGREFGKR